MPEIVNESGFTVGWCAGKVPPHALTATLVVKGTFDLQPGAAAALAPAQEPLDGDVEEAGGLRYASDLAWFKPRADVLLVGTCHQPKGRPNSVCMAGLRVGSWSKQLAVVGDRVRTRKWYLFATETEPIPFVSMKLTYDRAYGGEGYAKNPKGRGHADPIQPNLLSPERLYVDADSRPDPAGFAPLPLVRPQRSSKAGSYGNAWKTKHWPGLPADADWTLFNAAPPDQQLPAWLRGDERLEMQNLHPKHPKYESALPGVRARWFLRDEKGFHEVPLHLDTLWIDMDAEKLVLVWRGIVPAADRKLSRIVEHVIVREPLASQPRPAAEFAALLELRKEATAKAQEPPPPVPPRLPKLPKKPDMSWVEGVQAEVAKIRSRIADLEKEGMKAARRGGRLAEKAGLSWIPTKVPPPVDPAVAHGRILAAWERAKSHHPNPASFPPAPTLKDVTPPAFSDAKPEPPRIPPKREKRAPWTRESVAAHSSRDFRGQDLQGLDLSGLDLSGAQFADARLPSAKLAKAKLAGADFTGTNLSSADLAEADLTGAKLLRASLSKARLPAALLRNAALDGSDFSGAVLSRADLSGASAVRARFAGADLALARLVSADLSHADLGEASLAGADASSSVLKGAQAAQVRAAGAKFAGADLTKFAAPLGADFAGANLRNVRADQSIWSGAKLDGADLFEASLARANFTKASLAKAVLSRANLRWARLAEANLSDASLLKVNLFRGSLEGARLFRTDFRGSNLYEVEFLDAKIEESSFQEADVTGTRLA